MSEVKLQNYECEDKMVSHPSHYQSKNGLEVIDAIEAFTAELTGIEAVDTGNAIKYLCRWKKKNGLQDLEKAMWYLQHLINHVKEQSDTTIQIATIYGGGLACSPSNILTEKESN